MEGLELRLFNIISNVGEARSDYIEAIREAKQGHYDEAQKLMAEGAEAFNRGHDGHSELIQEETGGNPVKVSLLVIHAEDLLMSAETFKIFAMEMIDNYKRIDALEARLK
jgi:PTS system cellobiose-specific IIA component